MAIPLILIVPASNKPVVVTLGAAPLAAAALETLVTVDTLATYDPAATPAFAIVPLEEDDRSIGAPETLVN